MKQLKNTGDISLFQEIADLLYAAKQRVAYSVNKTIIAIYFEIGRLIIDNEQQGNERAGYGKSTLKDLSVKLSDEFGKGYSVYNLERMRKFYITYKTRSFSVGKSATLLRISEVPFELSWSHYLLLIKIENPEERNFYEIESQNNRWSFRELERQYESSLFERLVLSRDRIGIKELSKKGQILKRAIDSIKDPYVLDFLELPEANQYTESDLETAIINKLEQFLRELGKGFLFVGRQQRISIEDDNFWVDLVFYNRFLQCFVLIDLKIGKLKHQDLGQMQMYVNYYDEYVKNQDENKTIGIVLCRQKNETLVRITLPKENEQIFASKYQTILPGKEELRKLIEDRNDDN